MKQNDDHDGVLVLDSDAQCGLSVIRSLGEKHVSVTAGSHFDRSLGMLSRYSDGAYIHPDPQHDHYAFVSHLVDHLEQSDYDAVVPVQDHTAVILAHNKQKIEKTGTVVACEDWGPFNQAYDKAELFELVDPLDVPSPETYAPPAPREVKELAEKIEFPAVIKPRSKSHLKGSSYVVTLVTDENYVGSPEELCVRYREITRRHDLTEGQYPLVQEYIPGTTVTTVVLADHGDTVAYFQEERLRTYPSSGGNSALLTGIHEPTMLEYAERVIAELGWTGPAMVEFMRTPNGEFYLIEVNGRYWGSLPFAIESGVDFPWLHYLQLRGLDPSPFVDYGEYRTDFLQRRLLYEDIKWCWENIDEGNIGAVIPFLRSFATTRHTFIAVDDPIPTISALLQAVRMLFRSAVQRGLQPSPVLREEPTPRSEYTDSYNS